MSVVKAFARVLVCVELSNVLPLPTVQAQTQDQDCDQDGSHDHAMVNGERVEYSGATRRPFTTVIPEMFKVQDRRIHLITASMVSIPYKSDSGWD